MKKNMYRFAAVLFAASAALFVLSCATATAAAKTVAVVTKVTAADKYGNCTLAVALDDFSAKGFAAGDVVSVKAGSFAYEAPVGTNYSDVDTGKFVVLMRKGTVSLAINMGNFAKTSGAAADTPVTITLKQQGGYLTQYQIRQLKKSEDRTAYASDEIFANFRSVAAGKIAAGRLYRSCNPVLGDARAPFAAKLIENAKIQTVINLADSRETAAAHFADAPYYASLADSGNAVFLNMGVSFTDPEFVTKLHDGLVFLAEHKNGPYLVHCNEGKDRAGFVAAVLEAANGATLKEMTADYMLSFENYFGVKQGTEQWTTIGQTIPDMFKTMNGGKTVTDANVASVAENYLTKTVGLTAEQLAAVRANLQ